MNIAHLTDREIQVLDTLKGEMPKQIRDFALWVQSRLNDFDKIIPSCPGKIQPSDMDGVLHRRKNGQDWYLFFEMKATRGVDIPRGQWLLLDSLVKNLRPRATAIILYGETLQNTTHMKWWRYRKDNERVESGVIPCSVDDVSYLVMKWFFRLGDFSLKDLKSAFPNRFS